MSGPGGRARRRQLCPALRAAVGHHALRPRGRVFHLEAAFRIRQREARAGCAGDDAHQDARGGGAAVLCENAAGQGHRGGKDERRGEPTRTHTHKACRRKTGRFHAQPVLRLGNSRDEEGAIGTRARDHGLRNPVVACEQRAPRFHADRRSCHRLSPPVRDPAGQGRARAESHLDEVGAAFGAGFDTHGHEAGSLDAERNRGRLRRQREHESAVAARQGAGEGRRGRGLLGFPSRGLQAGLRGEGLHLGRAHRPARGRDPAAQLGSLSGAAHHQAGHGQREGESQGPHGARARS